MMKKNIDLISLSIRIWTILILVYTFYKGYVLGWTESMIPDVMDPFSSWSARALYANKGMYSLMHLNLFSIFLSTGLIVVPTVIYVFLIQPRIVLQSKMLIFGAFAILFVLSIYTFLRIDTPSNYYASRYFVPVLIPLLIFFFVVFLNTVRSRFLVALTLVSIVTFNFFYSYQIFKNPERTERFDLLRNIGKYVHQDSVVFLDVSENMERLLVPLLTKIGDYKVISISKMLEQQDYREAIDFYSKELNLFRPFIISHSPPNYNEIYNTIIFDDASPIWTIMYPTTTVKNRYTLYLFEPFREIKEIRMDDKNVDSLLTGFSFIENKDGVSWRWSIGDKSILKVPLHQNKGYQLFIKAAPFRVPDLVQKLYIELNGTLVGEYEFRTNGMESIMVSLPQDLVDWNNEIVFSYAYAKSPAEIFGTEDQRQLAVQFFGFEFRPID